MDKSGYYPDGADTSSAPWNEKHKKEKEIEVCISITLSKSVKIRVSDYTVVDSGVDEDGEPFEDIDYSTCDLKKAVEEQIILPQDIYMGMPPETKLYNDLKGWNVDDFEVCLDN